MADSYVRVRLGLEDDVKDIPKQERRHLKQRAIRTQKAGMAHQQPLLNLPILTVGYIYDTGHVADMSQHKDGRLTGNKTREFFVQGHLNSMP